ncbi:MAG: zinc-ribbon and DUF3426 domain-containing protein [Wenzhouxiangellaceae bacterium]|nr:zinc-ribbon and DUF3426 domain-containing protein [Wenzhouxiangellaceae bacterium]
MFTRCDHCRAILPLGFSDLAQAGGMVRCGSCGRTLNALSGLYEHAPGNDDVPIKASGMPPMLPPRVEQEEMIEAGPPVAENPAETPDQRGPELHLDLEPEPAPRWMRLLWPALALGLSGLLVLQFFGPEDWRVDPGALFLNDPVPVSVAEAVQLVSRDMHRHPSLSDAVVISAVLVNRSAYRVAWPNIELKLFDASQQVIGQRRLAPADYLAADADPGSGFEPDLRLPVVLEMVVDGSQPAGFSMTFY